MSENDPIPQEVRERMRSLQDVVAEEAIKKHARQCAVMWCEMLGSGVPYDVARDLVLDFQSVVLDSAFNDKGR